MEPGITWALWRLQRGCVASENPTELPAVRAGHPGEQLTYKSPWSHCSWPVQLFKNIHLGLEGRLFPRPTLPWLFKCLPLDDLQRKLMTWSCQKKEGFSEGTEVVFSTQHARSRLFIQPSTWQSCTSSTLPSGATLYMTLLWRLLRL